MGRLIDNEQVTLTDLFLFVHSFPCLSGKLVGWLS